MDKQQNKNLRFYKKDECIFFRKTKEEWGGFSNMASGYPLRIDGINILTSEALYQACRYPHLPDIQQKIIDQKSPMSAKMVGKPYRNQSRYDWDSVRVNIMRWSLRVKLINHFDKFANLLIATKDLPIVEWSLKDDFWGAKFNEDKDLFVGKNVLGRLLMELREEIKNGQYNQSFILNPLDISNFYLLEKPIPPLSLMNNISTLPNKDPLFSQESLF